jgi:FixJ family two-component response regulator
VDLHQVHTVAEARMLLSEVTFDAVLVTYELPDGNCFDVLSSLLDAAILVPVVVLTPYGHKDAALAAMKAGASDCIQKELDQRHLEVLPERLSEAMQRHRMVRQAAERSRRREQVRLIDTLRATVAAVKHEINNPLAIISGNAQLLLELARMMELDEEIVKPIRDIEEASLRITDSLDKLNGIKDLVNRDQLNGEEHRNGFGYR